jgi:predicted N-formylglutamate amidohydrolase
MSPPLRLLFTCEHAGNEVPNELTPFFHGAYGAQWPDISTSHRAWDLGALEAARALATTCEAPLLWTAVSRLVVDTNRSAHHPRVIDRALRSLPPAKRAALLADYHRPHRDRVAQQASDRAPTLHVAVHSFTPSLDGRERDVDVGILYDPSRRPERALASLWRDALVRALPRLRVRRNAPYRGVTDGLPTALRKRHPPSRYIGFELELNQRAWQPGHRGGGWPQPWLETLAATLRAAASDLPRLPPP